MNEEKNNSPGVERMLDTATSKLDEDPILALEIAEKALKEARIQNLTDAEKMALRMRARILARIGNYSKAIERYEENSILFKDDKKVLSETYKDIGLVLYYVSDYDRALKELDKSMKLAQELGDATIVAQVNNNKGIVLTALGRYDESIAMLELSLAQKNGIRNYPEVSIANTLASIGDLYDKKNEIYKAFDYFEKALRLYRKNKPGVAAQLCNIGNCLKSIGKKDEAVKHYEEALEIVRTIKHREFEANILYNLANAIAVLGDIKKAKKCFGESLKINNELGDPQAVANIKLEFSSIKTKERKFDESISLLKEAQEIAEKIRESPLSMKICEELANVYEMKKDY
ncbi:tetratricopeptide repeat protein [candidate division WOR-3 bacterium]|nr:tetratricopeptide repeat protein [candidate division WOR-3 bacterium]